MPTDLRGKIALLTGASRGVGRGVAQALAAAGGRAIPVVCDYRDAQVRALFDRIAAEQCELDILVNTVWGGYETLHAGQ